jgi:hypothetical protein
MKGLFAAALIVSICSSAAQAQNWRNWNDSDGKSVRISANFQITTPVASSASASDLTKALAQANQSLYDIINHQCDVIGAALKGDCRIVQLNVNGNINERIPQFTPPGERPNSQQIVNANANAVFLVESAATKDAPASKDAPAVKDAPASKDPMTLQ